MSKPPEYRTEEEMRLHKRYMRLYGEQFMNRHLKYKNDDLKWVLEPEFIDWATGAYRTKDEFKNWAFEKRIEAKLRQKFLEEMGIEEKEE